MAGRGGGSTNVPLIVAPFVPQGGRDGILAEESSLIFYRYSTPPLPGSVSDIVHSAMCVCVCVCHYQIRGDLLYDIWT